MGECTPLGVFLFPFIPPFDDWWFLVMKQPVSRVDDYTADIHMCLAAVLLTELMQCQDPPPVRAIGR